MDFSLALSRWLAAFLATLAALCVAVVSAGGARAQVQSPEAATPGSTPAVTLASIAASTPVPVESFFGRINMARLLLSPSGRHLAFLQTLASGRNQLSTLDLQNPQQPKGLVTYRDADIYGLRWLDDETLLYSLTDNQAGSGDVDFAPGLFSVSRSGGDARQLIKTHRQFVVDGNFAGTDRRLEPNHRLLMVPQDQSGEVIVGQLHRAAGELIAVEPLRLHVQTQRTRRLDEPGNGAPVNVNRWLFDAMGQLRVATVTAGGRVRVHWRAPSSMPGSSEWKQILDADRLRVPWHPYAVDAEGALYVVHTHGPEGTDVLSRFDFANGRPAIPPLVSVPGFDFKGSMVAERPGGRSLGVRALTDGEVTVWTDPGMKALQARIDGLLPGRINRLSCRGCDGASDKDQNPDQDRRTVLVESWADRDPGTYFLWQGEHQRLSRLGRSRNAIDPARMADLSFHTIKARDGRPLPVWLTLPPRASGAPPPPVVVLVHGGPMVRGGYWAWDALPQFLASRGYAVVEPEFRGSDGYGQAHLRAGWKQWGQAMQDDIADALRWATTQGHGDASRACIAGASYGGYATLMGLVRHPELYRCGIASMAVTDLMRFVEGSWWWRDDIADEGRRYDLPAMVGDAKTDADMLRLHSPVLQAARIKAPVLLVHGLLDKRVPVVHARDMRKALQAAGNEPEWLVFDEEGHGWRRLENQQTYARRVEDFLARHLKSSAASR